MSQKIEEFKIEELKPYSGNSRTHDKNQVAQIAKSIKEFGFTNPILIDGSNGVIAGHGRLMAAKKLSMENVPCIRLSHLSDAQRKAYVIADNKLALNAGWNEESLKAEFEELMIDGVDLEITGFSEKEIEKLFEEDEEEEPEVLFSEDLMLSHNYIVLYFDNELDWQVATDKFNLKKVKSADPAEGCQKVGVGRVINGKEFLK